MQDDRTARFERLVMPHLDAAYNLARWLTRRPQDAEDVAHDAMVRAFAALEQFRGGDARCWLLQIVRNCAYTSGRRNRRGGEPIGDEAAELPGREPDPAEQFADADERAGEAARLHAAIAALPGEFRETLVLREMEGLSYQEISQVVGVPIGTVMSRLARARGRLVEALRRREADGVRGGGR